MSGLREKATGVVKRLGGARHPAATLGVVKVLLEGDEIEVATFRSDHGTLDGRHPRAVRYARTPEEDVGRRDFTVNGLLYDPLAEKYLDFVGGPARIADGRP